MEGAKDTPNEVVVASCGAVLLFSSFGIAYGMAILFPSLHRDLQIPYWHLAACFSCSGAIYYLTGVASGRLSDRYGARIVAWSGQLILAAGLAAASLAQNGFELELSYIASIGFGVGLTYVPITGAVQALCPQKGTLAAGLSSAGIGLGACLVPPVAGHLLGTAGWRAVLWGYALFAVAASFACLPFIRSERPRRQSGSTLFRTDFLLLYAAQTLASLVVFVPFAHITTWITAQRGMPITSGIFLVSIIGFGSVVGRLALGLLGPYFGEVMVGAISSGLIAVSLVGLNLVEQLWMFAVLLFVFGAAYGSFNGLIGPLVIIVCGRHGVGQAVGALATSRAIGILLGPWLVGVGFTWLGRYTLPFVACSLAAACSCGLMLILHNRIDEHAPGNRNRRLAFSLMRTAGRQPVGSVALIEPATASAEGCGARVRVVGAPQAGPAGTSLEDVPVKAARDAGSSGGPSLWSR